MMNTTEKEAVATICLMAAFADGRKDDDERQQIKVVMDSLEGVSTPALLQKVLLKQVTLEGVAGALGSPETRSLAFEMAVGVCDADGVMSADERAFLEELGRALGLSKKAEQEVTETAEVLASSPLAVVPATSERMTQPDAATVAGEADESPDAMILKYAVLAGALELLPQSLATMAIVPLQMKLVYAVGQRHGYALGSGHLREFLAVAGVGMTSQVFEGYARKLFGKAAKKVGGKGGKKVAAGATGALLSFATTYGLGQVAEVYYAGGRTLSQGQLQEVFKGQLERGKTVFDQYQGTVQEQSRTLNLSDLPGLLKMQPGSGGF